MIQFRFGRPYDDLEHEVNRLLEHYRQPKRPPVQFRMSAWHPLVDLYETPDMLVALVELAGVAEEDVEVVVDGRTLTVRGQRSSHTRHERQAYHVLEINEGLFERVLSLPWKVDGEGTKAEFHRGLLEVCMPKLREQAVSITVQPTEV